MIISFGVAGGFDDVPSAPNTNYFGLCLIKRVIDEALRSIHAERPIVVYELVARD